MYVALLLIIGSAVLTAFTTITSSYRKVKAGAAVEGSVQLGMERMVREIRAAEDVDVSASVFATSSGVLVLQYTNDDGSALTKKWQLIDGALHLFVDDVDQGALTTDRVVVSDLTFYLITTAESKAVKIQMTLQSGSGAQETVANFYDTVVLRGSYDQ
jgi:hypothetical protein